VVYSAWGPEGRAYILAPGEGPPRFDDGTLMDPEARPVWRGEADSWEDAVRRYHEFQAWVSCRPSGEGEGGV
jgi:hypothetical protein